MVTRGQDQLAVITPASGRVIFNPGGKVFVSNRVGGGRLFAGSYAPGGAQNAAA